MGEMENLINYNTNRLERCVDCAATPGSLETSKYQHNKDRGDAR